MEGILNFLSSVTASVTAYFICKWIDDYNNHRNGR